MSTGQQTFMHFYLLLYALNHKFSLLYTVTSQELKSSHLFSFFSSFFLLLFFEDNINSCNIYVCLLIVCVIFLLEVFFFFFSKKNFRLQSHPQHVSSRNLHKNDCSWHTRNWFFFRHPRYRRERASEWVRGRNVERRILKDYNEWMSEWSDSLNRYYFTSNPYQRDISC